MSDSLGGVVSYTYDVARRAGQRDALGLGDHRAEAVEFAYDNAGNMTGLTRYSNLAETTVVAVDVVHLRLRQPDDRDHRQELQRHNAGLLRLHLRRRRPGDAGDADLELGLVDRHADLRLHEQQPVDQRVAHQRSFSNESFTWDANGNETGTGYTTSTGNEQTASPGYTYTYDADGNMITMTQTSTGDVWTYSYDFRNRMTGAVEKTSGGTILAQVTYTYDALDNRIGMDENGTQTWTLYDGSDPIMDFNSSGSLEMRYLNGPAGDLVDTVLARETSGGTVAWYLPDRLGTDPRPDQQLGVDHRSRRLQRLRHACWMSRARRTATG